MEVKAKKYTKQRVEAASGDSALKSVMEISLLLGLSLRKVLKLR